jgi:hypothetical protein
MTSNYRPELGYTPFLDVSAANYYMELIGFLRWIVELGCIDIMIDVSLLSSHTLQPRQGHLDQVFHIFGYLKRNRCAAIVFDESSVDWDENSFTKHDWSDFYRNAKELIPTNAPPPRSNSLQINCFVDADHAGNKITRRSHTGILIFLNRSPIIWSALQIAVEMLESLRYKLHMFGIPLEGPANVFCDNSSVVTNASQPASTLKKKHNSIAYHKVREAIAAQTIRIAWVQTNQNLADTLTKPLVGSKLHGLCEKIMYFYKPDQTEAQQAN